MWYTLMSIPANTEYNTCLEGLLNVTVPIPHHSPRMPITPKTEFKFDGFSMETAKSMVAMMDVDLSGKLGFDEFSLLWNDLRLWKVGRSLKLERVEYFI